MEHELSTMELSAKGGFVIRASLFEDLDGSPADADCYSPDDISAFNRGDWQYVGVVVVATFDGREFGRADIWSVEAGTMADGTVCDPWDAVVTYDLVDDAVAEARKNLSALVDKAVTAGLL